MRHVPGVRARVAAFFACLVAMALPLVAAGQRAPRRPPVPAPAPVAAPATKPGQGLAVTASELPAWPLYERFCLACHGARGDGRGPATPWLDPAPRDFTAGWFKWGGTADARDPAPGAIADVIRWGAPGTAMHGFAAALTDPQIDQLADLVRVLAGHDPLDLAPAARAGYGVPILDPAGKREQLARGRALWTQLGCVACHGEGGRGDGPGAAGLRDASGAAHPPPDLTAGPVRRPRAEDDLAAREAAALDVIVHGVGGTAMPGFDGAAPLSDLIALAAHVVSLGPATTEAIGDLSPATIARDRAGRLAVAGYRPGAHDDPDGALFGGEIPPQGEVPAALGPAQASQSSRQCARCHAKQVTEWKGSIHAAAASPGLIGQIIRFRDPAEVRSCLRCHAPLAEQQETPERDAALQAEGLTCAACHVRGGVRHGPPGRAPSLLPLPGYPLRELAVYERSDFCVGCHQLPARIAVNGRPLLDTYREWLLGPYMKRGVQCQHCHMPNREHTWKGVHDADTFRQGIAVAVTATRTPDGVVGVRARVSNVGAGHYLPTTPTPAAWLEIELVDAQGRAIGARASKRIGRHLRFAKGRFEEIEDTRIPPGGTIELARGWRHGKVADATHVQVRVRVKPDDYYEGLYRARLRSRLDAEVRAHFEKALARAVASAYIAYDERWEISAVR